MDKLISVIVPVYKVEKYLSRCIDSIIAQTYKNLEIFLIDDGSPDKSGRICDEYAKKDHRIRVLHKPNGGVSSARNLGLKEAKGEYIGFVDSDDYIAPQMYEVLINNIEKYDADISICGFSQEDQNGVFHRYWQESITETFDTVQQIDNLLSNRYYRCSIWDRIFKRKTLENVFFHDDIKIYEDMLFDYEAIKKSHKAVFTSTPYYYYCENDSSSAARSPFSDTKMDILRVFDIIKADIEKRYPILNKTAKREFTRNNIMCMQLAVSSGYDNKTNLKLIQRNIRKNLFSYLFSSAALGYKYSAVLISVNWRFYKVLKV